MEKKVLNLDVEYAFAWGITHKIRLFDEREMTYKEMEDFANAISKLTERKLRFHPSWELGKESAKIFSHKYVQYVMETKDGLKLDDSLESFDLFNIFPAMKKIPHDMVNIMLDKKVGNEVFKDYKKTKDGLNK